MAQASGFFLLACLACLVLRPASVLADSFIPTDNITMKMNAVVNPSDPTTWSCYGNVEALASNSLVPLHEINGAWPDYHPASGRNFAIAIGLAETGVAAGNWSVGLIDRVEWWALANQDSADLIYRDRQKLGTDPGHSYVLDYQLEGFNARGIKASRVANFSFSDSWHLTALGALSLLKGSRFRSDEVSGYGDVTSSDQIQISAQRDNIDTNLDTSPKYFNPYVPKGSPAGHGHGLDLGFSVASNDGYSVDVVVQDALAKMFWTEVPQATTIADNIAYTYDQYGNRNATVSGRDSRGDITEAIPTVKVVKVTAPVSIGYVQLSDSHFQGIDFPEIAIGHGAANWQAEASYDTRTKSVGFGYARQWLTLRVLSDSVREKDARTFGLVIGLRVGLN